MRRGTAMFVAAGLAAAAAGARAQEFQDGSRGSMVFAAGDKVHGYLRGGETHVLDVHLAKGDVYSFRVSAAKAGRLMLHLSLRDPSGLEINEMSHVRHASSGRSVTVGPFRAAATGTYLMELSGDGPYESTYSGVSKARAARASYILPSGRTPIDVPVAAGALLRLRAKGRVARLVTALPGQAASELSGDDAFVASLASRGLSSSASGVYGFAAPASNGAVRIDVRRPRWKAKDVEFPTLPDDPTLHAQRLEWFLGWQPQPQQPGPVDVPATTPPRAPTAVASAVAADRSTVVGASPATIFVSSPLDSATSAIFQRLQPVDVPPTGFTPLPISGDPTPVPSVLPIDPTPTPADPSTPALPPTDPATPAVPQLPATPPAVPAAPPTPVLSYAAVTIYGRPLLPSFEASQAIGRSAFLLDSAAGQPRWRNAPWTTAPLAYPKQVYDCLLPITDVLIHEQADAERGGDADPFVRRTFTNRQKFGLYGVGQDRGDAAVIQTTVRYYVDGHQVSDLLVAGGDVTIEWAVEGHGHTNSDEAWTIDGNWSMAMHSSTDDAPASAVLSGKEHYQAGTLEETVSTDGLVIKDRGIGADTRYDVAGTIVNDLNAPDGGVTQHEERILQPAQYDGDVAAKSLVLKVVTNGAESTNTVTWRGAYWYAAH